MNLCLINASEILKMILSLISDCDFVIIKIAWKRSFICWNANTVKGKDGNIKILPFDRIYISICGYNVLMYSIFSIQEYFAEEMSLTKQNKWYINNSIHYMNWKYRVGEITIKNHTWPRKNTLKWPIQAWIGKLFIFISGTLGKN